MLPISQVDQVTPIFGEYEETAIVALMLDHPEFVSSISRFLKHDLFKRPEVQYVVMNILDYYEKYEVFPTRPMLHDIITRQLTVDVPYYDEVLGLVDKKSDPREVPALKNRIIEWTKSQAYALLWNQETIAKYNAGDFAYIDEIIERAKRIQDIESKSLWFFDEIERLFSVDAIERLTTGFSRLDKELNDGGPAKKEMLVILAPTGVGKSLALVNMAAANIKNGRNVLYVTLELSDLMSAVRAMGVFTHRPIQDRVNHKDTLVKMINSIKASGAGDLVIHEFPPDEISVDQIYSLIDQLHKTRKWRPDVVVIDYLELMVSRRVSDNKDDYTRQKGVATQVRGLAGVENVLVFTATQTNRSGNDDTVIDVTKVAESYGKTMPMDYLVSINQTEQEYNAHPTPQARLYIAKNRNGKKFVSIPIKINYSTMNMEELIK